MGLNGGFLLCNGMRTGDLGLGGVLGSLLFIVQEHAEELGVVYQLLSRRGDVLEGSLVDVGLNGDRLLRVPQVASDRLRARSL